MVRVEKTTKNRDDFRVLMAGILFAIFLTIANPFVMKMWDTLVAERPFVTASLEVAQKGNSEPFILYDADATEPVDGVWVASMVDESGSQLATRRGNGSYNNSPDNLRSWSWFAFFDNDKGLNSPGVPNVPFKVCIRYIVTARDSGASDESPTYCSQLFTARR